MAKYAVKFEIEVLVDADFEVGEENEVVEDILTDDQWNELVGESIRHIEESSLSGNVAEIIRVEDDDEDDIEMPWDFGKHFL